MYNSGNVVLRGKGSVELRSLGPEDAPTLLAIIEEDRSSLEHAGAVNPYCAKSIEAVEAEIKSLEFDGAIGFGIWDDILKGRINLYHYNRSTARVMYFVGKSYRRQGIASQALRLTVEYAYEKGYDTVVALARDDNLASVGLLDANGFRLTAYNEGNKFEKPHWLFTHWKKLPQKASERQTLHRTTLHNSSDLIAERLEVLGLTSWLTVGESVTYRIMHTTSPVGYITGDGLEVIRGLKSIEVPAKTPHRILAVNASLFAVTEKPA